MSFVIDENKIEELLKSADQRYTVTVAPGGAVVETRAENHRSYYDYEGISGTVAAVPLSLSEETRDQLMTIRRRIEESGAPLKSANVLAREIERMRRR